MLKRIATLAGISLLLVLTACEEKGTTGVTLQENNVAAAQSESDAGKLEKARKFDWDHQIVSRTHGHIPRDSNISVEFKHAVVDAERVSQSASGIFKIKPKVKGVAIFDATNRIVFKPETSLKSGEKYTVTLHPNGLKGASNSSLPYTFDVAVIPLEYELTMNSLESVVGDSSAMLLRGELQFSDRVDAGRAAKVLKAKLQEQLLPIEWLSSVDGRIHQFIVQGIKRESFTSNLKLLWDGKPIGIDTAGSKDLIIPSSDEFKVLGVRLITLPKEKPFVQIALSGTHDSAQNLKGLIAVKPIPTQKKPKPKAIPFTMSADGNVIKLFIKDGTKGDVVISVDEGLKDVKGHRLGKTVNHTITLESLKPAVRFVGKGTILPANDVLEIPFEAANVNAVHVTATLIYPDNVGQFLQTNKLSGEYQLNRVGRQLWRKMIPLTSPNPAQWNRYTFDATELLKANPGGMYQLTLSIDRRFSTFDCPDGTAATKATDLPIVNYEDNGVSETSNWDASGSEYYQSTQSWSWKWEDRNKPCTDSYFQYSDNPVQDSNNFIASNIGLMAKRDDQGDMVIVTTDLRTAEPLKGVQLEIQNFQRQRLGTTISDSFGFSKVRIEEKPFLLIARKGKDMGYLKLNGKTALAVSHFNVGGEKIKKGLKGAIYGERGVWRPGDDIYLTFVLQDKENTIPENHPISMELINPKGKVVETITNTEPVGDFYRFKLKTDAKAETGKWLVKARLGGNTFSKTLAIETVRPNRLKIELDFGTEELHGYRDLPDGKLFAQWLHGADADGLKADISVRFREKTTKFERFENYVFDDPARKFDSAEQKIIDGRLSADGKLIFSRQFKPKAKPPGMLSAWFTNRVFEKGGTFSTSKQFMDFHAYENYVGIQLPAGDSARNMLLTDTRHAINLASLNADGKPVSLDRVQVTLYKVDWKWWWDKSADSLAGYTDANHTRKLQQAVVSTVDGQGTWQFQIDYPDWGRYLIRACDQQGKHCTGKTLYVDWPGWAGRAQEQNNGAANRLELFTDKESYTVGEKAQVHLPEAAQGRALVSIENGSDILSQQWVEFNQERRLVEVDITEGMAPNAYVNVALLQPHNKTNDRPIRLMGIIPLNVTDPKTHIKPLLSASDEWKPLSKQTVIVSEANGQPMEYTLAMVDEGLLGLTRFKTPDLHKRFYRKEALGVKTWDLFDDVVGAYGGKLERLLALGGGDEVQIDDAANKPKRFPPVVQFLGPFHLKKGEKRPHDLNLPAYIGAVRVMVVAGQNGAYGKADKSVFVRQPLMMQPSMPRVLSVNEEAVIPITLFATDETIKDVNVALETNDLVEIVGEDKTQVTFQKSGDKLAFLRVKTKAQAGQATLKFTASSGAHLVHSEINIDVRRPNSETSRYITQELDAGADWSETIKPYGEKGTNSAILEVSSAPPLGIEKHLNTLIRYPHGCLEQTTSAAFPQLYLSRLMSLGKGRNEQSETHVREAIEKIRNFQNSQGDFSYWPGGNATNAWSSLYAGHFLIEAERIGYQLPSGLKTDWVRKQSGLAQNWLAGDKNYAYVQAYRLYVLAMSGSPELGAMNRLRESQSLGAKARWLLAAAYQKAGQIEAAGNVVQGLVADPDAVLDKHAETFSTRLSDLGLQLETLVALNKTQDAERFVKAIANELAGTQHNTHGLAWALMSVAKSVNDAQGNSVSFDYSLGDGTFQNVQGKKAYLRQELGLMTSDTLLKLKNSSTNKLYASVIRKGVPALGDEESTAQGLSLDVRYAKPDSNGVLMNLASPIKQGSDIVITVMVKNIAGRSLENIALSHLLPTGWEVHNAQYSGKNAKNSEHDYQDVRDDRVYSYFGLKKGETKTFTMLVNAAFKGRYYLPAITVEPMYEPSIIARQKGQWVTVETPELEATSREVSAQSAERQTVRPNLDTAKVIVEKCWLYDDADEASRSKMYLIKNDKMNVLGEKTNAKKKVWKKIYFEGSKPIIKWVKAEDIEG
ncbi:MAG: Alpha-2-macroglobulin [uncultured Thiotrichaceae bacterium]|uniref:Alpha-2-macroglobulin n=1 Tax=uncultured Thiotrichaceae bacterium TaxID=298394 RepID=A0A6S6TMJ7_9GAMM|nr:MAG: Alpha-2-macroglobulin [uncultured Thiotrichaceae bacterium]